MTEVTNGQIDPAHYGPTGDIARHIASYCNGSARVHVYTAAFQALATARAEAEALRARVVELEKVLEPFPRIAELDKDKPSGASTMIGVNIIRRVTAAMTRAQEVSGD